MSVVVKDIYDGKKPDQLPPDPMDDEMKSLYKNIMSFDNKPAIEVARSAAMKTGVNPALLFSSAYQEGMNKAILKPNEVSAAFINAEKDQKLDTAKYPVDGFYNYGLDTFGDKYKQLQKYLPEGFQDRFKTYTAKNEKGEKVTTAAFVNNEDAMTAKAAMLKYSSDEVNNYAKEKGVKINPEDMDYFTLARYNTSLGNVKTMINEYAKAKDKKKFLENGETVMKQVHGNISGRLKRMSLANELLNQK